MKQFLLAALLATGLSHLALAQDAAFSGLQQAMDSDTYERAGLNKLSSEERATLDGFIRDYVAGKQKVAANAAASEAVENAVKQNKVRLPEVIESKLIGTYKGYGFRSLFRLENGQVWRPTNDEVVTSPPVENPSVVITKDGFSYKMSIAGSSTIRVKRAP